VEENRTMKARPSKTLVMFAYFFILASIVGLVLLWYFEVHRWAANRDYLAGLMVVAIPLAIIAGVWGGVRRVRRLEAESRDRDTGVS